MQSKYKACRSCGIILTPLWTNSTCPGCGNDLEPYNEPVPIQNIGTGELYYGNTDTNSN